MNTNPTNDVRLTPGAPENPSPATDAAAAGAHPFPGEVVAPVIPPVDPPLPPAVVTAAEAAALQLTPAQRTAIIQLTSGSTRCAAAVAAGVTRSTLYKWLNHDPNFQAAFNAWHRDLFSTAQGQLLAASQEAINAVITAIRGGDARLAWKLLESQGLTKLAKPGSTDVAYLQRQAELETKRTEIAERKEINKVSEEDMSTLALFVSPLCP